MDLKKIDPASLAIRHYPDPVLRQVARPVDEVGSAVRNIAERMIELMVQADGIGLAAPQVGLPLRLLVFSLSGKAEDVHVLINPELCHPQGSSEMEEGCLSLPGIRAKVRRAAVCTVWALDLEGNRFVMDTVDLAATVVQHEMDHLDGVLFIDRLKTVSRMACRRGLKQLEREYVGR